MNEELELIEIPDSNGDVCTYVGRYISVETVEQALSKCPGGLVDYPLQRSIQAQLPTQDEVAEVFFRFMLKCPQ